MKGGWGIIPQYCQGGPVLVGVMSAGLPRSVHGGVVVTFMAGYVRGQRGARSWAS